MGTLRADGFILLRDESALFKAHRFCRITLRIKLQDIIGLYLVLGRDTPTSRFLMLDLEQRHGC